ncbi:MAG: EAL domain-containing protein [Rhodoferax sp.]|jgi:diguanylate cyclase (GGDEF)-like protein/PAS domain S-box-containing protein|uniref:sensor domain-containing protein n=1 Tax=Rhodoferax sp. TaxID=50421 RepID=UPI001B556006|nr:EAL domain-containing protein [Rhodoferax sp.]MBP8285218.1 EAL domain-containing protein [Rhodoferax sp.]MBP9148008.1 EAL domain-containing protein [Rhodoferax sp.]MBP9734130.1 EAL domain-containing protein [Rhodoferax sp.]
MTSAGSGLAALKTERLERLKQRAQAVLGQHAGQPAAPPESTLDQARLLEDLRIYQIELELQNDELRAAQQDADLLRRRYQSLFEHMPLPALVVDGQGSIDDSNERAAALLGGTRPQTSPDNRFWKAVHQNDRTRVYAALREVRSGETLLLPQVQITHSDTRAPVFDVHLIGLSMDYKLDRRLLLLLVDRTAEVARAADQRFFSDLLDASHSLIYAVDRQGKVLLANHTMLQFLGLEREHVQGHSRNDFLPLRDAITLANTDTEVLQSGVAATLEEKIHGAGGAAVEFLTRKFPLRDLQGHIFGLGAISTDITVLKEQQRQQLLSETVFMASQEAIIITDAAGAIVRINPAFTRQTGFSADAVLGRSPRLLRSGKHSPDFYKGLWTSLNTTGCWSGEICNRRSDGQEYNVLCSINAVRDEDGAVMYYFAMQTDVTLLHQTQLRLLRQASYDELTDLPNRALFNDRASQLMASAKRHKQPFTLLFIDLDRFKEVNDTLGHPVGDLLLRAVARRLQEGVRQEDTVARVGGDEFAVLLPATDAQGAQAVAANLLARLREPLPLVAKKHYRPMASIGMASYPQDGDTPDLLLRNADIAMYGAKVSGRNRTAVYSPQMSLANDHAFALQNDLSEAIAKQQLRVYFQPKCQLGSGALMGAEALVRWERPGHGLQMPGEFLRVAEKTGLLGAIDQWVLSEALRHLGRWRLAGRWKDGWRMAVNQNVGDLQRPDLPKQVQRLLIQHGVPACGLELEITEDALLQQTPAQLSCLRALRDLGVALAIDDFGTGYSSLAYLHELPISVIKIDKSFVGNMLSNGNDAVLVRTIIDLAHNLGHTLVAEGIEQAGQAQRLSELGCESGQGYWLGRPIDALAFEQRWLGMPAA